MAVTMKFAPCLWFDTQAEEAAKFYVSIFKNSKINKITRFPAVGQEIHGKPAGSVMTVEFELDGQPFTALNGGPHFTFNEAVSVQVFCDTQGELDTYWDKLTRGGDAAGATVMHYHGISVPEWMASARTAVPTRSPLATRGIAVLVVLFNVIADVLYAVLDPRIRYR